MEGPAASENDCRATLLDVLELEKFRRKILDLVHIRDIVRSERVSQRWQRAVLSYLQHCRSVTLHYTRMPAYQSLPVLSHRTVVININRMPNLIKKLGSAVTRFIVTNRECHDDDQILKTIASNCPNVQYLEISDIPMYKSMETIVPVSESESESEDEWEYMKALRVSARDNNIASGGFIKFLKSDLKFLKVTTYKTFNYQIATQASCLWNLTSLQVHDFSKNMLMSLPLLLNRLPKLENIDLAHTMSEYTLSEEIIACFGRLQNLKSISLRNIVNNALLETFSRSLKLNHLEIHYKVNDGITFWRGIALLIKNQSPGIRLSFRHDIRFERLEDLNKELQLVGCGNVQVTHQMWKTACGLANQMCPYEVRLELITHPEENCEKLKVILHKTHLGNSDRL